MCTHLHTYLYVHVYQNVYLHTHSYIYGHIFTHTLAHTYARTHTHTPQVGGASVAQAPSICMHIYVCTSSTYTCTTCIRIYMLASVSALTGMSMGVIFFLLLRLLETQINNEMHLIVACCRRLQQTRKLFCLHFVHRGDTPSVRNRMFRKMHAQLLLNFSAKIQIFYKRKK